jgi:hypothetical protein
MSLGECIPAGTARCACRLVHRSQPRRHASYSALPRTAGDWHAVRVRGSRSSSERWRSHSPLARAVPLRAAASAPGSLDTPRPRSLAR